MQITPFHLSLMSEIQRENLILYYYRNIGLIDRQLYHKKLQEFIDDQKRRLANRNVVDYDRELEMILSSQIRSIVPFDYEA